MNIPFLAIWSHPTWVRNSSSHNYFTFFLHIFYDNSPDSGLSSPKFPEDPKLQKLSIHAMILQH